MNVKYDHSNIFAKILRGEMPCIKVYEDQHTLAFMDIMPQKPGHTLVIPKESAVTIYDLSDEACLSCMKTVKIVGKSIEKAMKSDGTTILQLNGVSAGQSVPHFHFHIFPGSPKDLKGHAVELEDAQKLKQVADKIIAFLEQDRQM